MPLARVKTWNPGDTLTAADLNGEFNNILNNPISLVSPTTGAINFQTSVAHTNLIPSALTASSGTRGQALLITSSAGSQWSNLGVGSHVKGLTGSVTTSQTVTLSANEYMLRTTEVANPASYILTATGTFTVNVGTAGPAANGRDVAAAFSSTFVHVYAITTGLGSTVPAGIASTTPPPTGPVFPTSYSASAYLGTFPYSSSSTTFTLPNLVRGALTYFDIDSSGTPQVLTNGTATAFTAVTISSLVPAIAGHAWIRFRTNGQFVGSGGSNDMFVRPTGSASTQGMLIAQGPNAGSNIPSVGINDTLFPLSTAGQIDYQMGQTTTAGGGNLYVIGYRVPNGDV